MLRYDSTAKMAESVLKTLKSQVVSNADIIPRTDDLPYDNRYCLLFASERDKKKYGSKLQTYVDHVYAVYAFRSIMSELADSQLDFSPDQITLQAATTFCGVGECGETSCRAMLEMLKAGCKEPITIMMVAGQFGTHVFLIIGKTPPEWNMQTSLDAFKQLSEDCVLLDPSLGIIGKAQDTPKLLEEIFSDYDVSNILPNHPLNTDSSNYDYASALKNAKKISLMAQEIYCQSATTVEETESRRRRVVKNNDHSEDVEKTAKKAPTDDSKNPSPFFRKVADTDPEYTSTESKKTSPRKY